MGYTVRTDDGYRLTRYVKYSTTGCHTRASSPRGRRRQRIPGADLELNNYNLDYGETVNQATNPRYVAQ